MSALDIILAPSPVLYKKTDFIVEIDKVVRKLSGNMFDTIYKFNGVGLAAPQVGKSIKMIVIDCSKTDEKFFPKTLINPKILEISDILEFREKAEFIQITSSGIVESHPHDINMTKDSPNYRKVNFK